MAILYYLSTLDKFISPFYRTAMINLTKRALSSTYWNLSY